MNTIHRDSPDDSQTGVSIRVLRPCRKLLTERHIGAVVILGADYRVIGILSERDIVRALAEHGPTVLSEPISQVMSRDV